MKWNVIYRSKGGKLGKIVAEAESRREVFKNLADMHISIISVEVTKEVRTISSATFLHKIVRYIICGIVLVAVVGTICTLMKGSGDNNVKQKSETVNKSHITNVKPNIVTNQSMRTVGNLPQNPSIISIKKTINPFTGKAMMFTNRHKQVKANAGIIGRNFPDNKYRPKRKLFKHYSENYICGIMRTPLGMPIVRGRLPKNFDDDFLKSYADEIKIELGDTEEEIALKQAMINFKNEIKGQIGNGESVLNIVLDSREERNRLAEYRKNLMKTISDLRHEGATKEELNEAREAANMMLDRKGLKRIPIADLPRKEDR